MRPEEGELVRVGEVTGTHGLRGDLKVRPLSPDARALAESDVVFTVRAGEPAIGRKPVRVAAQKKHILLRLEGVDDIEAASSLRGVDICVRRSLLASSETDETYWAEMQGAVVIDRRCGELGVLEDVFTTAAHDIYVVHGPFGEVLIPVVDDFIGEFDRDGRRLHVDLPEGLVTKADDV